MTTIINIPKDNEFFEVKDELDFESAFKEDYLINLFK